MLLNLRGHRTGVVFMSTRVLQSKHVRSSVPNRISWLYCRFPLRIFGSSFVVYTSTSAQCPSFGVSYACIGPGDGKFWSPETQGRFPLLRTLFTGKTRCVHNRGSTVYPLSTYVTTIVIFVEILIESTRGHILCVCTVSLLHL